VFAEGNVQSFRPISFVAEDEQDRRAAALRERLPNPDDCARVGSARANNAPAEENPAAGRIVLKQGSMSQLS
jgi:hypothetical protein